MFTWNCSRYTEYSKDCREAVDNGYALKYENLAQAVLPEEHCLSTDQCREVLDILVMFGELKGGYEALENEPTSRSGLLNFQDSTATTRVRVWGTAGSSATAVTVASKTSTGETISTSHMPTMDGYRRMLEVWK
jgi:uncharacterized protein YfbU (UPF0304 family)